MKSLHENPQWLWYLLGVVLVGALIHYDGPQERHMLKLLAATFAAYELGRLHKRVRELDERIDRLQK